jgi:hypothetical protein
MYDRLPACHSVHKNSRRSVIQERLQASCLHYIQFEGELRRYLRYAQTLFIHYALSYDYILLQYISRVCH